MNAVTTLELMSRLLALLAFVQGLEFLKLSFATSDRGVWRWQTIEEELAGQSRAFSAFFQVFLSETNFRFLNGARILAAASVFFSPSAFGVSLLLFFHILTLLRWLGTFNGGSDYMNLLLLLCVGVGLGFRGNVAKGCLWYVTFQLCLSYFRAGLFKLKVREWRNGTAVPAFVRSPLYESKPWLERATVSPTFNRISAWLVIGFELSFPVSLFHPQAALFFMGLGALFHLQNAYVFGLNRFVFAWLAAYPALYYCSDLAPWAR